MVVLVDRGRYRVMLDSDSPGGSARLVTAMRARELGRRSLAVGDEVSVVGDTSGRDGTLARIVALEPRRTTLRRSADDADSVERVIVANADQLAVVLSVADPAPRYGFADRALVAGYDGGLRPVIIATKDDLGPPDEIAATYGTLGIPVVPMHRGADLGDLRGLLAGRRTVLIGHSGVGKSTLVNMLVPDAERATGAVNTVTGRGRHTSTSVHSMRLPEGGWIIDTPGVRSFGLAHVDTSRIMRAFADLEPGVDDCPRACDHLDQYCALDSYAASGRAGPAAPARLASLRRLLRAMAAEGSPDDE